MLTIGRDPFARTTTTTRDANPTPSGCAWCGGLNGRGRLRCYEVETDGLRGRRSRVPGLFCSISCARSYHE